MFDQASYIVVLVVTASFWKLHVPEGVTIKADYKYTAGYKYTVYFGTASHKT